MQAIGLRKGMAVIYNKEICLVEEQRHYKPGKGKAFVQISFRGVKSGRVFQNKFSSDEDLEQAPLIPKAVQFLYQDGDGFHFMDMEDYHSFTMTNETVGDNKFYLKENMEFKIRFHEDVPILFELPSSIVLKVVESPPGIKGDTASGAVKPAKLETGLEVKVPLFIEEGEEVKVDTRSGEYQGRA